MDKAERRQYDLQRRQKLKLMGLCQDCSQPKEDVDKVFCYSCQHKRLKYQQSAHGKSIHNKASKKYKKTNRSKLQAYQNNRVKTDPAFRIIRCLRERVRQILKGTKRHIKTSDAIGCTKQQLVQHIENQWQDGMSWDNYGSGPGKWNIDHIYPFFLCDKTNLEQIIHNNHYTNLRPLWWEDNMSRDYNDIQNKEA